MTTARYSDTRTRRSRPRHRSEPGGTGCSSAWRRPPTPPPTTTTPPGAASGAGERRPESLFGRPSPPPEPRQNAQHCDDDRHDDERERRISPRSPMPSGTGEGELGGRLRFRLGLAGGRRSRGVGDIACTMSAAASWSWSWPPPQRGSRGVPWRTRSSSDDGRGGRRQSRCCRSGRCGGRPTPAPCCGGRRRGRRRHTLAGLGECRGGCHRRLGCRRRIRAGVLVAPSLDVRLSRVTVCSAGPTLA